MSGGRERAVTVWVARETLLLQRLDAAQDELRRIAATEDPLTPARVERASELEVEIRRVRLLLAQLGPSPRAKMG